MLNLYGNKPEQISIEKRARNWAMVLEQCPAETVAYVTAMISNNSRELADSFYNCLLENQENRQFLNHDIVHTRLRETMASWIAALFEARTGSDFEQQIVIQQKIGLTHARIGLPMALVNQAFLVLKRELANRLLWSDLSRASLMGGMQWVNETLDFANSIINETYLAECMANARAEQSFQHFAAAQDIAAECHAIQATLDRWMADLQKVLETGEKGLDRAGHLDEIANLSRSEFGFWVTHKARLVFPDAPELSAISHIIERADTLKNELSDALREMKSDSNLIEIKERLKIEKDLANDMLSVASVRAIERDEGSDRLTSLLDRRFLNAILQREVALATKPGCLFAIVLLECSDAGTLVKAGDTGLLTERMVSLSTACRQSARAHDFLFRYRPRTVLALLTETSTEAVEQFEKTVQRNFAGENESGVSVICGSALHDRQPDFARTLEKAEKQLNRSKQAKGTPDDP